MGNRYLESDENEKNIYFCKQYKGMCIVSFVTIWCNWNVKKGHQSCFMDKLEITLNSSDGSDIGSFFKHNIT